MDKSIIIALILILVKEVVSFARDRHSKLIEAMEKAAIEITALKNQVMNLAEQMREFQKFEDEVTNVKNEVMLLKNRNQKYRPN